MAESLVPTERERAAGGRIEVVARVRAVCRVLALCEVTDRVLVHASLTDALYPGLRETAQ